MGISLCRVDGDGWRSPLAGNLSGMSANLRSQVMAFQRRNQKNIKLLPISSQNQNFDRETNLAKVICEQNEVAFLQYFLMAISTPQNIILLNPQWQQSEQNFLREKLSITHLISTGIILELPNKQDYFYCLIPTGGTSGQVKFAVHTLATLSASVAGFRQFFGLEQVNCFCVLPLYHVSGLMQLWRSLLSGGEFYPGNYGALKQGILPKKDFSNFCISLVPTQLQVLLEVCPEWLAQFRLVLIGGAPPWRSLLEEARKYQIRIALTYGMTETASQVVALKPEDFLNGKNCAGQVLPHAQIQLSESGQISIQSKSLFLGYYPEISNQKRLETDDLGYFNKMGYLHILGRQSHKIISGGENIYPAEIEAVIQATNLVTDTAVLGIADRYWGEVVIAVVVLKKNSTIESIKVAIADQLSRYKQPKKWLAVTALPRNAQGKLNRTVLTEMIEKDYQSLEN